MFKNYLKIAFRNIVKSKVFSFVNIAGLAIGMSCCILILLFVKDELRFDRHHPNAERTYRIINTRHADGKASKVALTPPPLGPTLESTFPEVKESLRLFPLRFEKSLMAHGENKYFEEYIYLAEPSIFDFFHLPFVAGNPATALSEPNAVVITEDIAHKYFGEDDPVGKRLTMSNQIELQVTAVIENPGEHFHLKMDFIISFITLKDFIPQERMQSWVWQQFYNYIMLSEGSDPELFQAKLPDFIAKHADPQTKATGFWYRSQLQPVTDIHLHSANFRFDFSEKGDITYAYAFSIIAVFILLIACINFMNLSTARSAKRAKEVGMRKVIGAQRRQLIRQFLGESALTGILAVFLAIGLVELVLPTFNTFSSKHLALNLETNLAVLLALLGFGLAVGVLAGSYPAFFMSAFRPLNILKGELATYKKGFPLLRKILVVFQFAISIVLIVGTLVVFRQLDFARNKKLGFEEEQVVVLPMRGREMRRDYETIKSELLQNPKVVSVTACYGVPGGVVAGDDIRLPGQNNRPANVIVADHDYLETLGMQVIAGRDFSKDFRTDAGGAFILNETLAKEFGWSPEEAVGKKVEWDKWGQETSKKGKVIGVVTDFHLRSLHEEILPTVIHIYPSAFSSFVVRIRPENVASTLDFFQQKWQELAPTWPFEYEFLDQSLDQLYKSEQKLAQIFGLFSFLSIFIACLGLFGLASYMAEQRTKEVGIRTVLGATVSSIVKLFSTDFVKLVLIANLLAWPVAYYFMNRWLENFAYRVDIAWWVFVLAGALALIIALVTVSAQAIRAALANPVDSLRYE
ncbi:FtsX-like permease family protein [candidate division KSB1 bacterium]|nr:FtsX-like permease family protein [candidate division KSB1 bacterium]NIR71296.1 FtsX-like permease family protein [candidate division KSB1 bacterium]NIS24524.1 FtsX-like permease family protein [candidate division KSB1 bacterium]NIT71731.1 FtsX-like permease family protein [candidate division KSB1 bacterium]NIU25133.1 FtsX-like permease family protein [candidate division KSB1 bacterium]